LKVNLNVADIVIQAPYNVLFLCSANSSRSIMAERILDQLGAGKFKAYSAGIYPIGRVNPLAIDELQRREYPTDVLFSKSWLNFAGTDNIALDFVVYVCESAAVEPQPKWQGAPLYVYWNFPSPGAVEGADSAVRSAFSEVCGQIEACVQRFLSLSAGLTSRQSIHQAFIDASPVAK
jgi:arsenate reductase